MHQSIFEANLPEKPESITRKKISMVWKSCHTNKTKIQIGGGVSDGTCEHKISR